jgi:hypothetical protein
MQSAAILLLPGDQRMENMDTMPTVVEADKYFDLFEPADFGLLP